MIDGIADGRLFVVVAVAALVTPLAFVALVVAAAVARRRGAVLGPVTLRGIAFAAGLALGSMFLVGADDLAIGLPFLVVAAVIAYNEWRSGRRASTGWLVAGVALPWTLLWGAALLLPVAAVVIDPSVIARRFAVGALPLAAGLIVAGRFSAENLPRAGGVLPAATPAAQPTAAEPAAQPTEPQPPAAPAPRSFRSVARAIREPSQIGAIPLPELAAVVAWVAVGLASAFVPIGSELVRFVVAAVLGSAVASEAYVRAMAPRSRQAFEAFSWLGEQELRGLRAVTGERVPTSARAGRSWLARHPIAADEPAAIRSLRIEALLLAGRTDEARRAAEDRPAPTTPEERFQQAADRQLVAWWADEPDRDRRLADLAAAAAGIEPADGDAHLRAEVAMAAAELRERAVGSRPTASAGGGAAEATPAAEDALEPLVEVRRRLGARADGLLRRVLWRRLFGLFLAGSAAFELVGLLTGLVPPL